MISIPIIVFILILIPDTCVFLLLMYILFASIISTKRRDRYYEKELNEDEQEWTSKTNIKEHYY